MDSMPSTWSDTAAPAADWRDALLPLQVRFYQASIYVALTLVDDPAWLALMFC
jgi:hypothetical protein